MSHRTPTYTQRRKLRYILRLVPFVEKNFNLVELGPRGTGKSFVYQQISPYCHLVSGGQTTTAQMFVNLCYLASAGWLPLGRRRLRRGRGHSFSGQERHQHHEGLHGGRRLQPGS